MNYYQHHIGDYRADTTHLSLLEHGAYRQLIDWYYLNESPIPKETQVVFRRLSARTEEEKNAVLAVLSDFFAEKNGGFHHKRCDDELEKYRLKAEKNRQNGAKGGRPTKNNGEKVGEKPKKNPAGSKTKPKETLTNNQEPITNNQEEKKQTKKTAAAKAAPSGFVEFWNAYPKKVAKGEAEKAFKKLNSDAELLAVILRAIEVQKGGEAWTRDGGQYIPNPATWLNGKRWEDEVKPYVPEGAGKPQGAQKDAWFTSNEGIDRKGRELGMQPRPHESWNDYKDRIFKEIERRDAGGGV